ncbi:MAG: flagellar basal body-associated FliL family protein [Bdellovibrionaceae bacterium]|nr:flagellar basal body-associated FliL family protein [Pseudobdellovibrionaceae bacterium]
MKVAEEKAAAQEAAPSPAPGGQKPILFIALAVINMVVVVAVGWMLYQGRKKEAEKPTMDQVIQGEAETLHHEASQEKAFVGQVIPLESFLVNLAGSKGRQLQKVNMEFELQGDKTAEEIEKRKAQIRDIIIITLSAKTYDEVSTREGKDALRNEIKDTVNNFLTTGKIKNVFFTEFITN